MRHLIKIIQKYFINFFESIGLFFSLMSKIFRSYKSWSIYAPMIPEQMYLLGITSIPIVIVTGLFSGMVTAVNGAHQLESGIVPAWYIGSIITESVVLELGPMITGLVMTGKIGATIAAEIGTMRVSEQIDALESLSFDPVSFLIMPRIIAAAIMFPVLVIIADFFGILGGFVTAINSMDITTHSFLQGAKAWFRAWDAIFGVIKGFFFGIAITSIASYFGFYSTGGAQGVGKSTTTTVIVSCITIVLLDYILAEILL